MSKQNKKLQQEITSGFKQMEEVSTVSVMASSKSKKLFMAANACKEVTSLLPKTMSTLACV